MEPRLLKLHFTPTLTQQRLLAKTKYLVAPTTFRAGAVYIMKKRERKVFVLIYERKI
jgi:hypothetical protein